MNKLIVFCVLALTAFACDKGGNKPDVLADVQQVDSVTEGDVTASTDALEPSTDVSLTTDVEGTDAQSLDSTDNG